MVDYQDIEQTLEAATQRLLSLRDDRCHWTGELSSSALSTATSVCALSLVCRHHHDDNSSDRASLRKLIQHGFSWLIKHQNKDGGWGDTIESPSNISTTTLCWAALHMKTPSDQDVRYAEQRAESWMLSQAKSLSAADLSQAIDMVYGKDRTFSVPILTMCALSGRFGDGTSAWQHIRALPFELAACPHQWFRLVGLPVVSYALPALIAIGQARHHHRPTKNPVARWLRYMTKNKTLRVLQTIQPDTGGFLEAAPLTGFVLMSLASIGHSATPVAKQAIGFLVNSAREDGSWPIDTNLATWVTTLSIQALSGQGELTSTIGGNNQHATRHWLLNQQYQTEHPYTHAAPGGWAWTNLSGGVPDADDTAGALLALKALTQSISTDDDNLTKAVKRGVQWLMDLQNKDGGIPTFCRGWGKLPFDQSSPDLTAHSLRAWRVWRSLLSLKHQRHLDRASEKAVRYLLTTQCDNGTWIPLWFGNQYAKLQHNLIYGTSRVLRAPEDLFIEVNTKRSWHKARLRGLHWMLTSQHADGGWGGDVSTPSTIEETALAVETLSCQSQDLSTDDYTRVAIERGCDWLIEHTDQGTTFEPAPIGLYFAKLWYTERLYPLIFTISALGCAMHYLKRNHELSVVHTS